MQQERRINRRLVAYWEEIRGANDFPSFKDVDGDDIADIWDSCFIIKIKDGSEEPEHVYEYIGEEIVNAYGDDLTGEIVYDSLLPSSDKSFLPRIEEVLEDGEPVVDESEFTNMHNETIKYRRCFLPLSSDGDNIDYILGGMRWKSF